MDEEVVRVTDLEKTYGRVPVLNHCSLTIKKGEIYGLLGLNGAGKTTFMKVLLGLQRPDRGQISLFGRDALQERDCLALVGSMIEVPAFYEHLDGGEVLSMHLSYVNYYEKRDFAEKNFTPLKEQGNIREALRLVGLSGTERKPVSQYSLGMRQRLGLARAIVHRSELLVLDEPLNGLDPVGIQEMRELLKRLSGEGVSILLSSHIIGELRHTADRIGVLSGGKICREFLVAEKNRELGEQFEDYVVGLMSNEGI